MKQHTTNTLSTNHQQSKLHQSINDGGVLSGGFYFHKSEAKHFKKVGGRRAKNRRMIFMEMEKDYDEMIVNEETESVLCIYFLTTTWDKNSLVIWA